MIFKRFWQNFLCGGAMLAGSVCFLRDGQIWLLERDGKTQNQVTHESPGIESYDASPQNGSLVFIAWNFLITADAHGSNRIV